MRSFVDEQTKREIPEAGKIAGKTEGWLSDNEGAFLFLNARNGPCRGEIVEVGSWKGRSTIWLAKGSKSAKREKIHAIDPHIGSYEGKKENTYAQFRKNIRAAGVEDHVVSIVSKAEDAAKKWKKPVRFLWIDGSHNYEDVKRDVLIWEKFLVNGGVIALHDTVFREGPTKVSKELIKSGKFSDIGFVDDITFAVKDPEASKVSTAFSLLSRELALKLLWIRIPVFRNAVKKLFFKQYV